MAGIISVQIFMFIVVSVLFGGFLWVIIDRNAGWAILFFVLTLGGILLFLNVYFPVEATQIQTN